MAEMARFSPISPELSLSLAFLWELSSVLEVAVEGRHTVLLVLFIFESLCF
jgi:hypothetical protein